MTQTIIIMEIETIGKLTNLQGKIHKWYWRVKGVTANCFESWIRSKGETLTRSFPHLTASQEAGVNREMDKAIKMTTKEEIKILERHLGIV